MHSLWASLGIAAFACAPLAVALVLVLLARRGWPED